MAGGKPFDRDGMASWYANQHLKTDPGIKEIYYLKQATPEREIRLVEVNDLMVQQADHAIAPLDFGVEAGGRNAHKLIVMDVTPSQWEKIRRSELSLPEGWKLEGATPFQRSDE